MGDFQKALALTLQYESGYADDPDDPGGMTMKGVTQREYDAWLVRQRRPHRWVHDISDEEVADIYYSDYWQPAGCDALPWPLSACVFDFAVNSGVGRAVMELQRVVGADIDGRFGPQTRRLVIAAPLNATVHKLLDARRDYLRAIVAAKPKLTKFLRGWLLRVSQLASALLGPAENG